jgi:hypothetical protein
MSTLSDNSTDLITANDLSEALLSKRQQSNFRLPGELLDILNLYSANVNKSKTEVVIRALFNYLMDEIEEARRSVHPLTPARDLTREDLETLLAGSKPKL